MFCSDLKKSAAAAFLCIACVAATFAAAPRGHNKSFHPANSAITPSESDAVAAFESIVTVLRHPRCINCHSSGDFPRQGDEGHPHAMNVRRGTSGMGVTAEKCSVCHQDHNLAEAHLPPGAPGWRLPPAGTPMIWQGLTDREICEQLKDPARNGHNSPNDLIEHFGTDKLVAWGWNPGPGRTPVPMPRDELVAKVKIWVAAGGACPAR